MSLPLPVVILYLNYLGLIFGTFILFVYAARILKGGTVNVLKLLAVSAVVAWCIVCLTN